MHKIVIKALHKAKKLLLTGVVLLAVVTAFGAETSFAQADFCNSLSGEFSGFLDCSTSYSTFTDFRGGLAAPDVEGYDPSLTQASDARTYAKNIANFALGFLGLIAVLIIIYSGFLYVTSRGESDQMDKGKNGITYALIGILIIFASYALVNTVLQAPGGDANDIRQQAGLRGAGSGNRAVGTTNFNSVAKEVQTITTDLLKEYQRTQDLQTRLNSLTAYKPNSMTSRNDFVDYLTFLRTSLNDIARSQPVTSNLRVSAEAAVALVLNPGIQSIQQNITEEEINRIENDNFEGGLVQFGTSVASGFREFATGIFGGLGSGTSSNLRTTFNCNLPLSERPVNYTYLDCDRAERENTNTGLGTEIDAAFDKMILELIIPALNEDYKLVVAKNKTKLERQKNLVTRLRTTGGASSSLITPLDQVFTAAIEEVEKLSDTDGLFFSALTTGSFSDISSSDVSSANASVIRGVVTKLQELYNTVINLDFTVPVIIASTTSGSAPLVVTFDASQSYDPANRSLPNGSFSWDINGNGEQGDGGDVSCFGQAGTDKFTNAAITCVFRQPGQYLPSLIAMPNQIEGDTIALPGIAYIPISVTPPVAQIKLNATVGSGSPTVLREYDENGNIKIDLNEYSVTLDDAKTTGVTFDASGTDSSDTTGVRQITKYQWTFNDSGTVLSGSGQDVANIDNSTIESGNANKVTKKFNKRGEVNVQLAVTDSQGNIDRKIFVVRITDIVARINLVNATAPRVIGTEFVFDGSGSRSDITPNLQYNWTIEDLDPNGLDNVANTNFDDSQEFRYRFKNPGQKRVKLTVRVAGGSSGNEASTTFDLDIAAEKPTAVIDTRFPDSTNRPNFAVLDGSGSFSPHEDSNSDTDLKKYGWRIFNAAEGTDFEVVSGTLGSRSNAVNAPVNTTAGNSKLELLFKKKGTYKAELTVEAFGQKQVTTTDIVVNSVVDVKFADDQAYAFQLDNTAGSVIQTKVTFKLESRNATTAQINFGDNSAPITVRFAGGAAQVEHSYVRAGSYEVTVRAEKDGDINSVKAIFIVGSQEQPIAVPKVRIGGIQVSNLEAMPPVYRGTMLSFDASSSVNVDGTNSNLRYEWNFGDGRTVENAIVNNFTYQDLPPANPGYFEVKLTVTSTNQQSLNLSDTKSFQIKVEGSKPTLQSLLARTQPNRNTTPINVTAEAVGVQDKDGRVENYRFYYFPIADPGRQLGVKEVSVPSTTLTIDTFGEQNKEVEYGICVDLRDNDGNEVKCNELFPNANYTKVTVKNGNNEPPRAAFTVDRTNIKVGETVTFMSNSSDADGSIIEWTYDFEGDNSFTNDKVWEQGTVSHTYANKSSKDGFRVRLRVTDDKGATSVSQPVTIYVDGTLADPVAAFTYVSQDRTVQFTDKSEADEDNNGTIAKYEWDFNTRIDSDGDGNPRNDIDSTAKNPVHTYSNSGIYEVLLNIEDSEGNETSTTRQVVVQAIDPSKLNPYSTANAEGTADLIRTNPARDANNGRITVNGEAAIVTFTFEHLPSTTKRIFIDRNVYFDTNSGRPNTPGDGVRNNDVDIQQLSLVNVPIRYVRSEAPIRVQVAIEDQNGNIYADQADIVFAGSSLQARLGFDPTENMPAFIYLMSLIILILTSSIIVKNNPKKGKTKLKL